MRIRFRPADTFLARAMVRSGLVPAGLLIAGAALEIGVRLFAPDVREHSLPRELVPVDELLGWRLAPSERAVHKSQYFDTNYTTNTLGYRDEPRSSTVSGSHRVLLYGDSQVFGWGVPAERRFSNLLETGFAHLEVWNLAVPGYGVDQQVLSYERDAATWHADAVIFYVSAFTLDRLRYDYVFGFYKPVLRITGIDEIEVRPPKGLAPRRLLYAAPGWMYTPYFVDRLLTRSDQRWRGRGVAPEARALELLQTALSLAARIGRERGHTLFVVSADPPGEGEDVVRELCAALDIGYLSLGLPAERDGLVWGPYDGHWNLAAQQQIAENLAEQLHLDRL